MMRPRPVLGLLAAFAVGCSANVVEEPEAAVSATVGSTSSVSATAAGATGSGGEGGGSGEGGEPPMVIQASVHVSTRQYESAVGPAFGTEIDAHFRAVAPHPSDTCTQVLEGSCVAERCEYRQQEDDDSREPVPQDVGILEFQTPTLTHVFELEVDGNFTWATPERLYVGGELLVFSASGGADLPAFRAELVAPSRIEVTEPAFDEPLAVQGDVHFTWIPGAGGSVAVRVGTSESVDVGHDRWDHVRCTFDATAGQGTIPASLVARLPATSASVQGSMDVASFSREELELGGARLFVHARNETVSATSRYGSGEAAGSITVAR